MTALSLFLFFGGLAQVIFAQNDTLGIGNGYTSFETDLFYLELVTDSQTLASLRPKSSSGFDFSPFDYLYLRCDNGNYHVGDITFRYRNVGDTSWTDGDTSSARKPVDALSGSGVLAASNLAPTLPSSIPFNITRQWTSDHSGDLLLSVTVENTLDSAVELGSFGFPMEFNSIFTNRDDTEDVCSLTDPNIAMDAGYLRVTSLSGTQPVLLVTPVGSTPLEAWRFLPEDTGTSLAYQSQTFEGFYSWDVLTEAYAENEWSTVTPWNAPSSTVLQGGESVVFALRFSLADGVRDIDKAVAAVGIPTAVGVPGFIVPQDMEAQLFLFYDQAVTSITLDPVGAFTVTSIKSTDSNATVIYSLQPSATSWGRVRVSIQYEDGTLQTVHYYITKSAVQAIADLGHFLTTSQFFNDSSDPFERAASIISYDRSVNQQVLQEQRVWIAGLSDEAGAGSWLAAAMKQAAQPNADEVAIVDEFIETALFGTIQQPDYTVRKSVFYYDPTALPSYSYNQSIDWGIWWSWDKSDAYLTDRAYDYVHVTAAYWAMYRVARGYPSIATKQTWDWYLNQSYQTISYCMSTDSNGNFIVGYANEGLMGETVVGELLLDLQREGYTAEATSLESQMKVRAALWDTESVPFGSEQAWDSTGQEGVYYWSNYFNYTETVTKTIDSILGYMPTASHWGWNGNARRYWDNVYGGKLMRIERQIHHYGSGLNALPVLGWFELNPTDIYLLRVGYGGNSGPLSNIDEDGFASASFHSWPDTLAWDAYSGDYGPNFSGMVLGSGTFVITDDDLGTVAFGGNLAVTSDGAITVSPRDAVRRKVYLAQYGLRVTIDAGSIEQLVINPAASRISVTIAGGVSAVATTAMAESCILRVEQPVILEDIGPITMVTANLSQARGGWNVPLGSSAVEVVIAF